MPKQYSKAYTPTNGVRTDFKRLMNIFLSSATVRFEQFSEVWRALNMSYICAGRNTDREAREFVEKVLVIAREYFLPPYQFQVRVGGLYLLYAVYQIQPVSPKAKIRLTPQQWDDALYFQQQAKQQSHLDVVYVFNKLIQEQAFQFCFSPQEIGIQSYAWESEDAEVDLADEMKEEKCIINKLFNYESLEQLSYLQDQYQRMKVALAGAHATKPDKSLNVVKEELVEDIVLSLQGFKENVVNMSKRVGKSKEKAAEELNAVPQAVGNRRQALKNQAYIGSPGRKRSLRSAGSPEKDFNIDKANRAAQRALRKSKADSDEQNDSDLDLSEVSIGSTSGSQAADFPARPVNKKNHGSNLSMPVIASGAENSSSGDNSDDDYVPASEKTKVSGGKLRGQKIASRKKVQFKKPLKLSRNISQTEIRKASSRENVHDGKKQEKKDTETLSLPSSPQPVIEPSLSEETSAKSCETKVRLAKESDTEKSGFRIKWNPAIKLRSSEETVSTCTKKRRGRHNKHLQSYIKNREALEAELHDKSDKLETPQISLPRKHNTRIKRNKISSCAETDLEPPCKKKKSNSSHEIYTGSDARGVFRDLGDNASTECMEDVTETRPKSKGEESKLESEDSQTTRKGYKSNIHKSGLPVATNLPTKSTDQDSSPQNTHIGAKNDADEAQSSYKIVLAPTASQNYADMGDNARGLPLQLNFPKTQFSHSMKGKIVKMSGQQKQSRFAKSSGDDNLKSSDLQQENASPSIAESSSNSLPIEKRSSSSQIKNRNMSSDGQTEHDSHKESNHPSTQKGVKKCSAQNVEMTEEQKALIGYQQPRKSRYYTIPSGFGKEAAEQPSEKPVLHQEKLAKVFKNMTETKKEMPIKPLSRTLQLMQQYREKLAKESKRTKDGASLVKSKLQSSDDSTKIVLDSVKFL